MPVPVTMRAMSTPNLLLLCLPAAGGGASIYTRWSAVLAPTVGVRPVTLPGRERLISEAPLRDCATLIDRLLPDVASQLDRPYAIFGHSMGALVAFELTHALRQAGHPEPTCLVLSGYPAVTIPRRGPAIHDASEDVVIDALRGFGGVPNEVLAIRDYRDYMLPLARADLAVIETYRYTPRPHLTCPVFAVGGEHDRTCPPEELEAWRDQTTGAFNRRLFPGGHFYLFEGPQFLEFLRTTLAS